MNTSLALLLALAIAPAAGAPSPFAFRDIGATGLELADSGKPVFVYNHGMMLAPGFPETMRRSSYLHPVYAPDGTVLTDDFNADHPHHRGISWMWPEVAVDGKKGDIWMVKGFQQRFIRWGARQADDHAARLAVENGWFDGDRKFMKEDVEIVVHAASAGQRVLEFTLRFEATDRPVEIAGTSEGGKGFGGFCMRFALRDGGAAKTTIRTEQGLRRRTASWRRTPGRRLRGPFTASRRGPGGRSTRTPDIRTTAGCCGTASAFERLLSRQKAAEDRARQAAGAEVPRAAVLRREPGGYCCAGQNSGRPGQRPELVILPPRDHNAAGSQGYGLSGRRSSPVPRCSRGIATTPFFRAIENSRHAAG